MPEKMIDRVCQMCGKAFQMRAAIVGFTPGKYCSQKCNAARLIRPIEDRFWEKVRKREGDGCWIWTGARGQKGCGQIWHNGKAVGAPRVAYEMAHGPFDQSLDVCHHCDNPLCVRADHLFLGTTKENMQDMKAKGRGRGGRSYWRVHKTSEIVTSTRPSASTISPPEIDPPPPVNLTASTSG